MWIANAEQAALNYKWSAVIWPSGLILSTYYYIVVFEIFCRPLPLLAVTFASVPVRELQKECASKANATAKKEEEDEAERERRSMRTSPGI